MDQMKNKRKKREILGFLFVLAVLAVSIWQWKSNREKAGTISDNPGIARGEDFSEGLSITDPARIPDYTGEPYVFLADNLPSFNTYDLENRFGEEYRPLDELGRCGPAVARLHRSMMPKDSREDIGGIKPSGWVQHKYEGIVDSTPPYLYNRCHLIAFAMTGQNANERNLITGTRYLNAESMLLWEKKVLQYLDSSENHVLYRVTPLFLGEELVARGVEMEAFSVEDQGKGLCFHVFVYNVQPGIRIDYSTGENRVEKE